MLEQGCLFGIGEGPHLRVGHADHADHAAIVSKARRGDRAFHAGGARSGPGLSAVIGLEVAHGHAGAPLGRKAR